jgi:indolepyruvate decarboxylase
VKERKTDPETLREALAEAVKMINSSKKPVILADVEIHRFGLQKELVKLVEKTRIPIAATILGKSVISEKHPQYIGVYEGAMGRQQIQEIVEGSDCVIMLGTFLTDINLGIFTARLDRAKAIEVTSQKVQIQHHHYDLVDLRDFIQGLLKSDLKPTSYAPEMKPANGNGAGSKDADAPMTVKRLFQQLNDFLTDDMVVVCDVGDCLFGAADLVIHRRTEFLAPAYYTSMGFGIPGALGAQMANSQLRPVAIVGDGAFQMTGQELSTILRLGLNPIVIVLNNHGYTTERFILDGPFNDITDWRYEKITELLGGGRGLVVKTPRQFEEAWQTALKNTESFSLLNVQVDKMDHSPSLHRLGQYLASHLHKARANKKS